MAQNQAWTLRQHPDGPITAACFSRKDVPVPQPGPGQVVIKVLYISVDPYLRIKLYPAKAGEEPAKGEFAPFVVGEPLDSAILGEVVDANGTSLAVGDRVTTFGPWQMLVSVDADKVVKVSEELPLSSYLNVTGLIGLSTYFPVVEIGQPKNGETVFVSGAGGAVGSLVGQLFKAFGCKVIGSTGSDNKVETLRSIGFDAAFNYKSRSVEEALDELAPEGVDIYWDNVGGPVLDAMLARMRHAGRIIACGSISQYDHLQQPYALKNYFNIVTKCIKYQGFLAFDYMSRQEECVQKLTLLINQGKVKPLETIVEGFDKVAEAFVGLFAGENTGKMLIKVAEPIAPPKQAKEEASEQTGEISPAVAALKREIAQTKELVMLSKGRARESLEGVLKKLGQELKAKTTAVQAKPSTTPAAAAAQPKAPSSSAPSSGGGASDRLTYTAINSFGWDQGEYNHPWVSVYVSLEGVGEVKDNVTCNFTSDSFDLKVHGLNGRNLRLYKNNLDKEIVPAESKIVVKKNRVTVQLKKVKGEFSYDQWMDLTAKRPKSDTKSSDPTGGIMDLMKNLYEEGDGNMKKVIGEAMMKATRGEKTTPPGMPSLDDSM